ncbi:MAG: GvpL/GvpF family gas vesicle protein [Actinomycetia bacterium]|nr:GvpL/GvpF family gas vesicle protein [Actinomycetes bacterium]
MASPEMVTSTRPVYFYGLVRGDIAEAVAATQTIDGESGLFGVRHGEITAIVSDARNERYQVSRKFMLRHEAVVEAAMNVQDVLPARFGVVRELTSLVDDLLAPHHGDLMVELERMAGCAEFGVKISWRNLQTVVAGVVAADPVLQRARERLGPRTPQRTRLDIGKRVEAKMEAAKTREGEGAVSAITASGPTVDVSIGKIIDELMVVNASFLVRRACADEFTAAVEAFDRASGDKYLIQIIGPLPPYSFVTFGQEGRQ